MEDYKKKYDDLIERLRKAKNDNDYCDERYCCVIDELAPDVKESEDERIRKALIDGFKRYNDGSLFNGCLVREILSWLEKQGKNNTDKIIERARTEKQRVLLTETNGDANIDWDCRSLDDVKTLLKFGLDFIRTIEADKQILADNRFGGCSLRVPTRYDKGIKQGEQKPKKCIYSKDNYTDEERLVLCDGCDEICKLKQKPAWSEEDDAKLKSILFHIEDVENKDVIDWLKSLKNRVGLQPKIEWTLADRNLMSAAIAFVKQNNSFNCWAGVTKDGVVAFLRSLRPQNRWKPSDEQMELLREVQQALLGKDCHNRFVNFMYELKILREEDV